MLVAARWHDLCIESLQVPRKKGNAMARYLSRPGLPVRCQRREVRVVAAACFLGALHAPGWPLQALRHAAPRVASLFAVLMAVAIAASLVSLPGGVAAGGSADSAWGPAFTQALRALTHFSTPAAPHRPVLSTRTVAMGIRG